MRRSVRWTAIAWPATEELVLRTEGDVIIADSIVTGAYGDGSARVEYHLELDTHWQVLRVSVQEGDTRIDPERDSGGTWRDGDGVLLPDLAGCIDVDISITPFTNTLPIRRLRLAERESAEIRVVYIKVPGLTLRPTRQRYTNLGNGRYRYEALDRGFTTVMTVDACGLVLECPDLFRRLT